MILVNIFIQSCQVMFFVLYEYLRLLIFYGNCNYDLVNGNAYWVRDGVKRIQYYRTENLNNL